MDNLVGAVRRALEARNHEAALFMALTLPDICARLEADDRRSNGVRYAAWFEKFVADKYRAEIGPARELHVFLGGDDCYALRCAVLHEGGTDITEQRARKALDEFWFSAPDSGAGPHLNQFNGALQVNAATFAEDLCAGVEAWLADFRATQPDKVGRLDSLLSIKSTIMKNMIQIG